MISLSQVIGELTTQSSRRRREFTDHFISFSGVAPLYSTRNPIQSFTVNSFKPPLTSPAAAISRNFGSVEFVKWPTPSAAAKYRGAAAFFRTVGFFAAGEAADKQQIERKIERSVIFIGIDARVRKSEWCCELESKRDVRLKDVKFI